MFRGGHYYEGGNTQAHEISERKTNFIYPDRRETGEKKEMIDMQGIGRIPRQGAFRALSLALTAGASYGGLRYGKAHLKESESRGVD